MGSDVDGEEAGDETGTVDVLVTGAVVEPSLLVARSDVDGDDAGDETSTVAVLVSDAAEEL
jgi:hypothetical protein